jgi:type I protein arginine methyltransferase
VTTYSLRSFGAMVTDDVRMCAYVRALEAAIKPGSIVVDIGAGTGVHSLIACRLGARKVYAVEPNPAVEIAAESARANGFEDRIVIVRGMSTDLQLEERANVIVSDLRGILPYWENHIPTIVDARERLLASGGALIPQRDDVHAAVVSVPEDYAEAAGPWTERFGVDLSAGRRWTLNSFFKSRFKPEQLLTESARVATLDYSEVTDPTLRSELRWTVRTSGTAHGIGAWFSTILFGSAGFSNAPGEPDALYGRTFFPWPEPVSVTAGDTVACALSAWLVDDNYLWRWRSHVRDKTGATVAEFDQSTFWSWPVDREHLARGSSAFVPAPTAEMEADAFVLANVDGARSLGEISRELHRRFPERFADPTQALNHVARLSRRYQ